MQYKKIVYRYQKNPCVYSTLAYTYKIQINNFLYKNSESHLHYQQRRFLLCRVGFALSHSHQ